MFFRNQWWLGVIVGFIPTMATFSPNFINSNRKEGIVCRIYEEETRMRLPGKPSAESISLFLVLNDSSRFSTSATEYQERILENKPVNKKVKIIYFRTTDIGNVISGLKIEDKVIIDDNYYLVGFSFLCILWIAWGGIAQLIRLWKSAPVTVTTRKDKI